MLLSLTALKRVIICCAINSEFRWIVVSCILLWLRLSCINMFEITAGADCIIGWRYSRLCVTEHVWSSVPNNEDHVDSRQCKFIKQLNDISAFILDTFHYYVAMYCSVSSWVYCALCCRKVYFLTCWLQVATICVCGEWQVKLKQGWNVCWIMYVINLYHQLVKLLLTFSTPLLLQLVHRLEIHDWVTK